MSEHDTESAENAESMAQAKDKKSKPSGLLPVPQMGTKTLPFTTMDDDHADEDLSCDPCRLKQKSVVANAFCLFCKKYMCVDCQHDHNTADTTASHMLLIGNEMPPTRTKQSQRKEVNMCEKHAFRMAEFYCPKHKTVFCINCKDNKHIRCPEVVHVKKISKGIKAGKDLPTTLKNFRKMVIEFERVKTIKLSHQEQMEDYLAESIMSINALRKELNTKLDNLEQNMKETIQNKFAKELGDIEEQKTRCEANVSILQEEIAILDSVRMSEEQNCFIALLKAKQRYNQCEHALNKLTKYKREMKYEFESNQRLLYFLRELDTLGTIKSTIVRPKSANRTSTPAQTPMGEAPSNMMAALKKGKEFVLCGEHKIDSPEDNKRVCTVSGSTFLPDGRLLICDSRNNSVKLFDHIMQLKSTLKLPATPYDVTGMKTRELVITIPEKKELHFAIMDPDLRATHVIKTETGCHGIRYHRNGLLTTCYTHGMFGMVLLMDTNGHVLQRFERDIDGNPIFQGPYYIAVNPIRDRFYVTDKAANSVLGLTMGGKVLFRYRSKDLEAPGSITVDKEGAIYVCGRDTKNIHLIKPDGRKIKVFQSEDGLEASSICYRVADGLFIVATNHSDSVRSYKLI